MYGYYRRLEMSSGDIYRYPRAETQQHDESKKVTVQYDESSDLRIASRIFQDLFTPTHNARPSIAAAATFSPLFHEIEIAHFQARIAART